MKKTFNIILFTFLIHSFYQAQFTPRFKKIKSISLEINSEAKINKGTPFVFTVFATTKKDKKRQINSSSNLKVWGDNFILIGKNKIKILKSSNCDLKEITINYSLTKKDKVFSGVKVVPLNYKGDLNCVFSGANGRTGSKGVNGTFKGVVFRDGSDGENGGIGNDGAEGHKIKVFVVEDTLVHLIKIEVLDLTDNKRFCYYTTKESKVKIVSNGGNGGKGGSGANGKNGKQGKVTSKGKKKRAGNGGDGGFGASGGNGGKGGQITVFIHESTVVFQNNIETKVEGGNGGVFGKPGNGGKAGVPLEGEVKYKDGNKGNEGSNGKKGENGLPVNYKEVKNYNFILN